MWLHLRYNLVQNRSETLDWAAQAEVDQLEIALINLLATCYPETRFEDATTLRTVRKVIADVDSSRCGARDGA